MSSTGLLPTRVADPFKKGMGTHVRGVSIFILHFELRLIASLLRESPVESTSTPQPRFSFVGYFPREAVWKHRTQSNQLQLWRPLSRLPSNGCDRHSRKSEDCSPRADSRPRQRFGEGQEIAARLRIHRPQQERFRRSRFHSPP